MTFQVVVVTRRRHVRPSMKQGIQFATVMMTNMASWFMGLVFVVVTVGTELMSWQCQICAKFRARQVGLENVLTGILLVGCLEDLSS